MDDEYDRIERDFRRLFENDLPTFVERRLRVKLHQHIPDTYVAVASDECVNSFVLGQFYSCIMVCQAVAEGLAKFLADSNGIKTSKDHIALTNKLQRAKIISPAVFAAFKTIRGNDRNDYHHLNPTVVQGYRELEQRAEDCVNGIFQIESEVFEFRPGQEGTMALKNPKYWKAETTTGVMVYIRGDRVCADVMSVPLLATASRNRRPSGGEGE